MYIYISYIHIYISIYIYELHWVMANGRSRDRNGIFESLAFGHSRHCSWKNSWSNWLGSLNRSISIYEESRKLFDPSTCVQGIMHHVFLHLNYLSSAAWQLSCNSNLIYILTCIYRHKYVTSSSSFPITLIEPAPRPLVFAWNLVRTFQILPRRPMPIDRQPAGWREARGGLSWVCKLNILHPNFFILFIWIELCWW